MAEEKIKIYEDGDINHIELHETIRGILHDTKCKEDWLFITLHEGRQWQSFSDARRVLAMAMHIFEQVIVAHPEYREEILSSIDAVLKPETEEYKNITKILEKAKPYKFKKK